MFSTIKSILRDTLPYHRYKRIRAKFAAHIHHYPAEKLFIVWVTGTDGKTTTCTLVYHLLRSAWYKTVFIGTTGAEIDWKEVEWVEKMTSYDPMDLQNILENAVQYWCTHAVIEVSSHWLEQSRFDYVSFHCAGLTNITAEHLDYHKNIDRYASTKQKLFYKLQKSGNKWTAVLPLDDDFGKRRSHRMRFWKTYTYGFGNNAQLQATHIEEHEKHTDFILNFMGQKHQIKTPLVGKFNIKNVLAAIWLVLWAGVPLTTILEHIPTYVQAKWRQHHVHLWGIDRYIDYAHTPNGLDMMLSYLESIKKWWRVICVFGAPGERDREKRPNMWRVADRIADIIILTDDDAANEDRRQIIRDILPGIQRQEWSTFAILPDRRTAIRYACLIAKPWDKVLFAWIGHQKVLLTNAWKIAWDEEKVLIEERNAKKI